MFKLNDREVFCFLGKVKNFLNEKSNNMKQMFIPLLQYASPTVEAMEEIEEIQGDSSLPSWIF